MNVVHPASAGLRQIADMLDAMADEGLVPAAKLEFQVSKADFTAVRTRLDLPLTSKGKADDQFSIVRASRDIGGLHVEVWNWMSALCEKRFVTKQVEVWMCGDEEITK